MDSVVGFAGKQWEVHKFGGTSVASAECYRKVARIVEDLLGGRRVAADGDDQMVAVVVSAMGGKPKTTDLLLATVEASANRDSERTEAIIQQILEKHFTCLDELFGETHAHLKETITSDLNDIRDILKTVSLMKWQASRIQELVSGYGELWSAQILSCLLQQRSLSLDDEEEFTPKYDYVDARRIITIDEEAIKDGAVCWDICQDKLQQVYQPGTNMVITGYVASNTHGVATTLQRDGSDYSAAIVGKLLRASRITIWTDVDGVLSADPRRVPAAQVLTDVSYNEAMELAYFGAKVIHPKTMQPAISAQPQIPIYIRNTFQPTFPGTRIYTSSTTHKDRDKCVCGFSSIEHMALINVEGSGLIGVPGVAKRMFGTLESIGVNVVLISQASSEHSITFATLEAQASDAKTAIEEEFSRELRAARISNVDVQAPCSIIAAVGDGMSATAGVAGRFFSALGDAKINVLAISQGCSERNISAVVLTNESTRALRAVHAAFRLSHTTVRVGLVGTNELGESLLKLLEGQRHKLRARYDVDLQVTVVLKDGNSDRLVCLKDDKDGGMDSITIDSYNTAVGTSARQEQPHAVGFEGEDSTDLAKSETGGLSGFMTHLVSDACAHHVVFDCTAEEKLGKLHAEWLRGGVHVVTANNMGLSGPPEQRAEIVAAEVAQGKLSAQYLREVTVGGALPVLSTLRKLLNSGDKIRRIDGILSVSLSFILFRMSPPPGVATCIEFDEVSSSGAFQDDLSLSSSNGEKPCSFREALEEAVDLGMMEDDPSEDLSNAYTSRVLMILAKELNLDQHYTKEEIQASSDKLISDMTGLDLNNLPPEVEKEIQDRVDAAHARGCVLRHIASVDIKAQRIEIQLVEVPNNHVFATTPPSCECVRFFTQRHQRYPLIVQGPSEGADSTASALLAELLTLMRSKVGPRTGTLSRSSSLVF